MLKLFTVVHPRKKTADQELESFLFRHPWVGMLLCGVIAPIFVLAAVSALCCAVMYPIAFFMGWL